MDRDFSKRRFDQDFVKCLTTLESLAKSKGQQSRNFGETNRTMINTIAYSYTKAMKDIISMNAHLITNTELDKLVELSTAFGEVTHKNFSEALGAESDKEAYLASTLEYWTSVQSRLDEDFYKMTVLQLDDLIDDALLQLHYAAQTVEQDTTNVLHNLAFEKVGKGGAATLEADRIDDAEDRMTDAE